jgi:hypothetical protein
MKTRLTCGASLRAALWLVFWMVTPLAGRASDMMSIYDGFTGCQLLVRATCVEVASSNCVLRVEVVRRNRLSQKFAEGDLLNLPLTEFRHFSPRIDDTIWLFLQQSRVVPGQWVLLKGFPLYFSKETASQIERLFRLYEMEPALEQIAEAERWIRDGPPLLQRNADEVLWHRYREPSTRVSGAVVDIWLRLMDLSDANRANFGVRAFVSIRDSRSIPSLTRWARSGEPGVSGSAVWALAHQNPAHPTAGLISLTQNPDSETRRLAVISLISGKPRDPAAVAAVKKATDDPEQAVRREALKRLAFYADDAEAAETLWVWSLQILEGEFDAVEREAAAWSLHNHRGKPHPEAVERMLAIAAKEPLTNQLRRVTFPLLWAIQTQSRGLTQAQLKSVLAPHFRDLERIARLDLDACDAACALLAGLDTEEAWRIIEEVAKDRTAYYLPASIKLLQQRREAMAPDTKPAAAPESKLQE